MFRHSQWIPKPWQIVQALGMKTAIAVTAKDRALLGRLVADRNTSAKVVTVPATGTIRHRKKLKMTGDNPDVRAAIHCR